MILMMKRKLHLQQMQQWKESAEVKYVILQSKRYLEIINKGFHFWISSDVCPGFQCQSGSLACMLFRLHPIDSSNSTLVSHLLASW